MDKPCTNYNNIFKIFFHFESIWVELKSSLDNNFSSNWSTNSRQIMILFSNSVGHLSYSVNSRADWATLKRSFYFSFCPLSTLPPDLKNFSWLCPCLTSVVWPGANYIQWGQSIQIFSKNLYRIGPRSDSGKVRWSFLWSVGLSVRGGVRRRRGESDSGRTEVFTSL